MAYRGVARVLLESGREAWDGPSHGLGLCYLLLVRCHFENFCGLSRCSSGSIGEQQKHVIGTLISFVSYVVEAASFRLSLSMWKERNNRIFNFWRSWLRIHCQSNNEKLGCFEEGF